MNQRQRFIRKIIYACVIAALLLPLSWLSQPATRDSEGKEFEGGVLARMRKEHQLSQAALGEIDPASETIKLATLGMRGVAANILWEKANYYKKTKDWTSLSATLEQIVKLQPNFVSVWIYQGWNLSYNISVEFDDYHDRYYWVMKGIDFLKEGTSYNTQEPRLVSEIGETIGRKIGRSDERVQFRRLFREDDDFNGPLPLAQRDCWLVARKWLLDSQQMVEQGIPMRGKSPILFYAQAPMCLISYGEALEEDGKFGEVAKDAWRKAADAWSIYGNRDLPSVYNFPIRLSDKESYDERAAAAADELARLTPEGLRETIHAERVAGLAAEQRELLDVPAEQRSTEQNDQMSEINARLKIRPIEIADRITGENRAAALKAAEEVMRAEEISSAIDIERGIVNFPYWRMRCQLEPRDDTLQARKLVYDADQEFLQGHLVKSGELYEQGWQKWAGVLNDFPKLLNESTAIDELIDSIRHYRSVLQQLDEKFPEPFVLQNVLDADAKFRGVQVAKTTDAQAADAPSASATDANKPEEPATPGDANAPDEPSAPALGDEPAKS
jgi:hypothetical protein